MQRQLLRGVPDPVVFARLAEMITGRRAVRALRGDDREEGVVGRIDDAGGEGAFEHDDAGTVGQRANQFGLQARRSVREVAAAGYTGTLARTSTACG